MLAKIARWAALFAFTPLFASAAFAAPAQVVLIRHGEKPPTGSELDARGWQRAQALVGFFETDPDMLQYGPPFAIYAATPSHPGGSVRSIETVTPLAQNLGLTINENFTRDQIPELVNAIMSNPAYEGRMVLICWEHTVIPRIVQQFGWTSGPASWPGAGVFDRAWVLDFSGGQAVSFRDLPENVLPGDSPN